MELRYLEYERDTALKALVLLEDGQTREARFTVEYVFRDYMPPNKNIISLVNEDTRIFDLETSLSVNTIRSFVLAVTSFAHVASDSGAPNPRAEEGERWVRSHLPASQEPEADPHAISHRESPADPTVVPPQARPPASSPRTGPEKQDGTGRKDVRLRRLEYEQDRKFRAVVLLGDGQTCEIRFEVHGEGDTAKVVSEPHLADLGALINDEARAFDVAVLAFACAAAGDRIVAVDRRT